MSFLDAYKRLDNLCKDIFHSDTGITSYINEMECCGYLKIKITSWDSDYKQLKHYRYIRNQIVHEDWANEANLCNLNDIMWIENFRTKILNQTDPLAQYQKVLNNSLRMQPPKPVVRPQKKTPHIEKENYSGRPADKKTTHIYGFLIAVLILILVCCFAALQK